MNQINFQQIGGFPFETETLNALQQAYNIFNSYGAVLGDKVIVSGCNLVGSTVQDGIIYLNDELLVFKSGTLQNKIYIAEDVQEVEFEDGSNKPVYHTRFATFGDTVDSVNWSEFKRIDPIVSLMSRLDELEKTNAVFKGGLSSVWWRGSATSIPDGWVEDTGMRGLVPVGQLPNDSSFGVLGASGGEKAVELTQENLPDITLERKVGKETPAGGSESIWSNRPGDDFVEEIELGGENSPHNNLQPYRVGLWIKRNNN